MSAGKMLHARNFVGLRTQTLEIRGNIVTQTQFMIMTAIYYLISF